MQASVSFEMKAGRAKGSPVGGNLVSAQNKLAERGEALIQRVEDSVRLARKHDNKRDDHLSAKGQVLVGEVLPAYCHKSIMMASPSECSSPYMKLIGKPRSSEKSPLNGVSSFYLNDLGRGVSYKREGDTETFQELRHNSGFLTVVRDNREGTLTITDPLFDQFSF
jgi:hypothetical protein